MIPRPKIVDCPSDPPVKIETKLMRLPKAPEAPWANSSSADWSTPGSGTKNPMR
jgi:hypothetical protein